MQYLSSRRGVYSGICALVVFACLILLSGTMGFSNNTEPANAQALSYHTYVITGSGFFIRLTHGMMNVLGWGILIGLLCLVVIGVMRRSIVMMTLPGIFYIIAATMIGQEYFQVYNNSWVTENTVAVAALMTLLGVLALTVFDRWKPAMIPRMPDAPPADARSERSPVAVDHRP